MTDDHVTVTGTAHRAVAPGAATWRAEAVETDNDPRAAFERCSTRLNGLVERLDGLGAPRRGPGATARSADPATETWSSFTSARLA